MSGLLVRVRLYVKERAFVAKLVQGGRKLGLPRNEDLGIGRGGLKEPVADRP